MSQRRAIVGIVAAFAASGLTMAGCGFQSPDVQVTEHASVQAADFSVGAVRVRDAFVTSTGGTVSLVVTFVNDGTTADNLTGVTTSLGTATILAGGESAVGVGDAGLALPPKGVVVSVDTADAAPNGPNIEIAASAAPVVGTYVPVSFTFSDGRSSPTEQVPVVPEGETTAAAVPVPTETASVPSEEGVRSSD